MKKIYILCGILLFTCGTFPQAFANDYYYESGDPAFDSRPKAFQNWYIALTGAFSQQQDIKTRNQSPNAKIRFRTGEGGTFSLGRIIPQYPSVRVAAEVSYFYNKAAWVKPDGLGKFTAKGAVGYLNGFLNVYYDIQPEVFKDFSVYLGAGIGYSYAMISNIRNNTLGTVIRESQRGLAAGQVMAGIGYEFTPSWTLIGGYRLMFMEKPTFRGPAGSPNVKLQHPILSVLEVGLRINI